MENESFANAVQGELQELSSRDFQLWSIATLVAIVLVIGFFAVVAPTVQWSMRSIHTEARYLPQLFFGLIALIVLVNVYLVQQRRALTAARERLVRQLLVS